jgi:hypothetical protein
LRNIKLFFLKNYALKNAATDDLLSIMARKAIWKDDATFKALWLTNRSSSEEATRLLHRLFMEAYLQLLIA